MIEIIFFSLISNSVFYSYGHLIKIEKFHNKISSINNRAIIGCIFISFIALLVNFIIPLDKLFNTIILLIGILLLILNKKKLKKKEVFYLFLSSLITASLILYSNVYRPDAGLYHLSYVSFLNENKIIFGLSNVHFRFGAISIMQYLSAINNNFLFNDIGIVIPLASIVSFFIIHFFNNVLNILKKNKTTTLANIFSLFIIIFISYKMNRYSEYGNDAVAHFSYFYLISRILENNKINLNLISIISVFTFLNKSTMIIILLVPLFFLIKNFKLKDLKIIYSLSSLLFIFWIIKNVIISGCMIYPLKQSCFENFSWTDINEVEYESKSGEAWSKDWPNKIDKNISMKKYNQNFNWISSWSKNHGIFIANIILPYFLVIILIYYYLKHGNSKNLFSFKKNNHLIFLFIISLVGSILFFLKFPLYRYGYSYLISSLILFLLLSIRNIDKNRFNFIAKFMLILCIFVISAKQTLRYADNLNSNFQWPRIYSYKKNVKIVSKQINFNNHFVIYQADGLCMYSKSPCTNYKIKDNIDIIKKFNYYFINLNS